ncbi:hypothetical protein MSC49_40650 (plasmid) [Methylosinus sp. C49]|nr:hypothetical protein MSC49_40650 [Methylosinus sp. C49]
MVASATKGTCLVQNEDNTSIIGAQNSKKIYEETRQVGLFWRPRGFLQLPQNMFHDDRDVTQTLIVALAQYITDAVAKCVREV